MKLLTAFTAEFFINGDSAVTVSAYDGNAGTAFFTEIDAFTIFRLAPRAFHGHLYTSSKNYSGL